MSARLNWAAQRVSADLAPLGFPPLSLEQGPDGPMIVWELPEANGRFLVSSSAGVESAVQYVADQIQDVVIAHLFHAWPEVDGRPLWPSADSGVACWCLDGKPWCAVGQLAGAVAAAEGEQPAIEPEE